MIRGYATLFDVTTVRDYPPNEVLDRRCFRRLPRTAPVLLNHRRRIGTARVWVDRRGLRFELPGHTLPRDFAGCSVKLRIVRERDLNMLHRIVEAELRHISINTEPVAFPATRHLTKEYPDDRR